MKSSVKNLSWLLAAFPLTAAFSVELAQAQSIAPARDGTNTIVTPNGNQLDINGGQLSRDGRNLFHSFTRFGLTNEQIANFLSNPSIVNILGRINGGNPSIINGLIQITGGRANLFLMNPSGFVFGPNASLNVSGSFFATTANGMRFGSNWLNATGPVDYQNLVGMPNAFAFTANIPGSIINLGNLAVSEGQNLTLLAGSVISTGQLSAPGGQITITAVPGRNLVRISQEGSPISLEVQPLVDETGLSPLDSGISPVSLPQLLTDANVGDATQVSVNSNGVVELTGSGVEIQNGDVVVKNATAQNSTLAAARNLTLVESQLRSTGDLNLLAQDTVFVRDSIANPFLALAGGNLYVRGNRSIDILALNHPGITAFQSLGNLTLVSDGNISGDAHFASGGSFSLRNLSGGPGNFFSLFDPVIIATGDVIFGDYTGAALKVETTGSIQGGNITITSPDSPGSIPSTDPDFAILTTSRALILRAGLPSVGIPNLTSSLLFGGTTFTTPPLSPPLSLPPGSIQVKNVNTSSTISGVNGGPVILEAFGNIEVTSINTTSSSGPNTNAGSVTLSAGGNITVSGNTTVPSSPSIVANGSIDDGQGGNITITSKTGAINISGLNEGGTITLSADGNINTSDIGTRGKDITITSNNGIIDTSKGLLSSTDSTISGNITLKAQGNIITSGLGSFSVGQGGNITLTSLSGDIKTTNPFNFFLNSSGGSKGGNITLTAAGSITTSGLDAGGVSNGGTISLTGKEIDFPTGGTVNDIRSTGQLLLQPATPEQAITIGSTSNIPGTLSLTTSDLAALSNGFSSITIGRADGSGTITIAGPVSFNDPVTIQSPVGAGSINSTGASIIGSDDASISLIANQNITVGDIFTNDQNISLTSNSGAITTGTLIGSVSSNTNNANNITLKASGKITTADIYLDSLGGGAGGNIEIFSSNDSIKTGAIISGSTTGDAGATIITANNGGVDTGVILSQGVTKGGNVTISSGANINTGDIKAASNNGTAGNVTLSSSGGSVTTKGAILTPGFGSGNGGAVSIKASGDIIINGTSPNPTIDSSSVSGSGGNINVVSTNGNINTSTGTINSSSSNGSGGAVSINAPQLISVDTINTQGGSSGTGGSVNISTQNFFQAKGTFIDRNQTNASISTAGGTGGGAITIQHGGNGNTPFIVGDATTNGTAGAITSGADNTITPTQSFRRSYTQGNIQINTNAPPNQPPVAENKTATETANDRAVRLPSLTASDTDGTVEFFTITTLPPASEGVVYLGDPASGGVPVTVGQRLNATEAANLYFLPNQNFTGNASFTYTATDNEGTVSAVPASVTIPVNLPPNQPPTADNKTAPATNNNTAVRLPPLTASDPDGTIVSFTIVTLPSPSEGVVYLGDPANGGVPVTLGQVLDSNQAANLYFLPNNTFTGNASFTYTATDNRNAVAIVPASVIIPVNLSNQAPTADNKTAPSTTNTTTIQLPALSATDLDGTVVSYTIVTIPPPSQGVVYLGNPANGGTPVQVGQVLTPGEVSNLYFQPNTGFTGNVNFTYIATDNLGAVAVSPATVTIPVTLPLNQPPVADNQTAPATPNTTTIQLPALTATDPDGTVVSYTILSLPPANQGVLYLGDPSTGGTPLQVGQVLAPGQVGNLYFQPNAGFTGNAAFTYIVTDNLGAIALTPAAVTLPVTLPLNQSPVATNDSITTQQNTSVSTNLLINDTDPNNDNLTITEISQGANGRVVVNSDGTITYIPNPGFIGNDTFSYTISDGRGGIATAIANITVNAPPNQVPIANNDRLVTQQSIPVSTNLLLNDTDPDNDSLSIAEINQTGNGRVVLNPDGTITYTPNPGFIGNDTFSYTISDGRGGTANATATVTVENLPNPEQLQVATTLQLPQINNVAQLQVDTIVGSIDQSFTRQFEQQLGLAGESSIATVSETQNILRRIASATGVKPAIVYARFVPETTTLNNVNEPIRPQDSDRLELIIVTASGNPIQKIVPGATRGKVLQEAEKFYREISDPEKIANPNYLPLAQQLYQWLIAPLDAELQQQGIQNIGFIMDVGLRSIPIAALHDGKQFVVEKYSVGLLPSLSLTDTRYASIKNSKVLAMGASEFPADQQQDPLQAVPAEISTIARTLWQGNFFLNQQFTLDNLKFQRKQEPFGIIHLATHVDFEPGDQTNSYIQLYNSRLRLNQLRELGWNSPPVELLVLSACRSALGDEQAELGFAGLAVQAGVKSAIASLWYVSDAGTLGLMTEFYRYLNTAPIKSEALRQAQIAMIQSKVRIEGNQLIGSNGSINLTPELASYLQKNTIGNLSHPFYWAAFTMIGSPW